MSTHPTRRTILFAGAVTTLGHRAGWAQENYRTYRLGILSSAETNNRQNPGWVVFFDEMGKAGFVEGKNLIVDWRFLGSPEQTACAATELVQLAPDVLLPAGSTPAITAAQAATRTIPLVATADDMVGSGLVPQLARPGGNLTGVSLLATELDGKRLEILMELVPACRHMAVLADPAVTAQPQLDALRSAAASRGVELSIYPARGAKDIAAAVDTAQAAGATALNVLASPDLNDNRRIILDRTAALRLPAMYQWPRRWACRRSPRRRQRHAPGSSPSRGCGSRSCAAVRRGRCPSHVAGRSKRGRSPRPAGRRVEPAEGISVIVL